jgi:nucleoside-diphosphate-sugar epimerase
MSGKALVLGAAGQLGTAVAEAFRMAGWEVIGQVRPGASHRVPPGIRALETMERDPVVEAARGSDVVVHALSPRYTEWRQRAVPLAYSAIAAAEASGATLLFPGNVYNHGGGMPALLDEATAMVPTTRKGKVRVEIERVLRDASERGVRTVILRAGDVFGGGRGSWFDLVLAKELRRGIVTYPGPADVVHAWAYLPDLAATFVRLAEMRAQWGAFEVFGFPGHGVTGREFAAAIAKAVQRDLRIKRMSWWLIHGLGPFVPICGELSEMAYLWQRPHQIAGDKLKSALGEVAHTPLDVAVARSLRNLGLA